MIDEIGAEEKKGLELLLDTSYPLLKSFRLSCPGTYKHSQSLTSMIEGISLALGLDVNFMKVCSMYHDIGKTFNPKYFTENQLDDEDPHFDVNPLRSYEIITRHVSDSVVILINEHNFPRSIIEVISQHHGTSVLKSFLNKSGLDAEEIFRYKTTKPTCVESAVLMICDCVEATARALTQAHKFNATDTINDTINYLLEDGQLDSVMVRLGDLKKIKESLGRELEGVFQKRVDYGEYKNGEHKK